MRRKAGGQEGEVIEWVLHEGTLRGGEGEDNFLDDNRC